MRKRKHKQPQYVTTKTGESFPFLKTKLFHLHVKGTIQTHIIKQHAGIWGGFLDKHLCQKPWVWILHVPLEISDLLT